MEATALKLLDIDLDIIAKLDDEPNDVGGLSGDALKREFDKSGNLIKRYINESLIPDIEYGLTKASQGAGPSGGIDGETLKDDSVDDIKIKSLDGKKIKRGTLPIESLPPESISREYLADDATKLKEEDFPNGVVSQRALAPNSVSSLQLEKSSVTGEKIAPDLKSLYVSLSIPTNWAGVAPFRNRVLVRGMKVAEDISITLDEDKATSDMSEAYASLVMESAADGVVKYVSNVLPDVTISLSITQTLKAKTGTTWTGSAAPYSQEIPVDGLLANNVPDATYDENSGITLVSASADKLTVYASKKITTKVEITITQTVKADVKRDEWTSSAPFSQSVDVNGLLESDRPKVYFTAPDNYSDMAAQQNAFAMLYDVESADGSVTFKAKGKPSVAINVTLEVNRI